METLMECIDGRNLIQVKKKTFVSSLNKSFYYVDINRKSYLVIDSMMVDKLTTSPPSPTPPPPLSFITKFFWRVKSCL